jgi:hypothetical protein
MAEILDNIVHGMLERGERLTGASTTRSYEVTLAPPAGRCCREFTVSAVSRLSRD